MQRVARKVRSYQPPNSVKWRRLSSAQAVEESVDEESFSYVHDEGFGKQPYRNPPFTSLPSKTSPVVELQKPFEPKKVAISRSSLVVLPTPVKDGRHQVWDVYGIVPSEKSDMIAVLEACLHLNNIDRAQVILDHLLKKIEPGDPMAVSINNKYLKGLLTNGKNTAATYRKMEQWYQKMEKNYEVLGNAETFAIQLSGALRLENGLEPIKYLLNVWKKRKGHVGEVLAEDCMTTDDIERITSLIGLRQADLPESHHYLLSSEIGRPAHAQLNLPLVNPTVSSGPGLALLQKSLRTLTSANDMLGGGRSSDITRQRALEEDALDSAIARWRHDFEEMVNRGGLDLKGLNALFWEWHAAAVPLIKEEINRIDAAYDKVSSKSLKHTKVPKTKAAEDLEEAINAHTSGLGDSSPMTRASQNERRRYGPFLKLLSADKLSAITILELIKTHSTGGVAEGMRTGRAVISIGKAVEMEYISERLKKSLHNRSNADLNRVFRNERLLGMAAKKLRANAIHRDDPESSTVSHDWPRAIQAKLGAVLISIIMHVAKVEATATDRATGLPVTEEFPAFHHTYQYLKGQKVGVIKVHSKIMKQLSSEPLRGNIQPRLLPMIAPPRPWMSSSEGGYYYTKTSVMRTKESQEQVQYLQEASRRGNLDQIYSSLDVLGRTAWRINRPVFDIIVQVWNRGQAFAGIASSNSVPNFPAAPQTTNPGERADYARLCRELVFARNNAHSQRCDTNYKLEISRAFLNEKMYFPHNIDFRGRAYTIPPHLNHIGNDLCRGLLQFHQGKPLGARGLRWLKIHLAGLTGNDKASFSDREKYVMENLDNIYDSVRNPLDGRLWWSKADDPWQALATCFELVAALDSPDPTKYISHLPLHQDGTCNGLQHYAALGGDVAGAKQVNLEPSDRPQDVYTGVADLVTTSVEEDAAKGHGIAKSLLGKITRKVVKQTVMTNVYGVTFIGARAQIHHRLKDRGDFEGEALFQASTYLAHKTFDALRSMFTGAHKIQNWLAECAKLISKSTDPSQTNRDKMSSVIWTTPMGLPVVQPYRKSSQRQIATNLQTVFLSDPTSVKETNSRKQCSAFPPNFIHSLDATHMMMSALACAEAGIEFAAVHDSYWTHACDIDTMNDVLREAFIKMHSQDIIGQLREEFIERYKGFKTLVSVASSSKEGKKILEWRKQRTLRRQASAKEGLIHESIGVDSGALGYGFIGMAEKLADEEMEEGHSPGMDSVGVNTKPAQSNVKNVSAWFELKFPELPEKGVFDVRNLKQSRYFFS